MSPRRVAVALTLALLSAFGPATAVADSTIRAGQHFVGLVNGKSDNAVVYVACAGPVVPDRRTHPLSGQSISVARQSAGGGFTGTASTRIVARFLDDKSVGVKFTSYGVPQKVPTSILVPCGGKGVVRFAPRPPSSTSVPDFVEVTYVNIAV
jgi:hypothetical protein